jgi:hypothetical protein
MYLTTEEELLELIDRNLTAKLMQRLAETTEDYIDFTHNMVEELLIKRYVRNKPFESQQHAFRYVAVIIFKGARHAWYNRKNRNTYCYDLSFFTGEEEYSLKGEDIPQYKASEDYDIDGFLRMLKPKMKRIFPAGFDRYWDRMTSDGERFDDSKAKRRMDNFVRKEIAIWARHN